MPVANRVETVHSALSLVLAGEAWRSFPPAPSSAARPASCSGPFLDADDAIDVAACWRRDSLNPLVRNFLKCAETVIRQA